MEIAYLLKERETRETREERETRETREENEYTDASVCLSKRIM